MNLGQYSKWYKKLISGQKNISLNGVATNPEQMVSREIPAPGYGSSETGCAVRRFRVAPSFDRCRRPQRRQPRTQLVLLRCTRICLDPAIQSCHRDRMQWCKRKPQNQLRVETLEMVTHATTKYRCMWTIAYNVVDEMVAYSAPTNARVVSSVDARIVLNQIVPDAVIAGCELYVAPTRDIECSARSA